MQPILRRLSPGETPCLIPPISSKNAHKIKVIPLPNPSGNYGASLGLFTSRQSPLTTPFARYNSCFHSHAASDARNCPGIGHSALGRVSNAPASPGTSMNGMKQLDVYWHIYRRDQIKPGLRGELIYFLEIPAFPGALVARQILDPSGLDFPAQPFLSATHHGILYQGVSKSAADDLMLLDPSVQRADPRFVFYNRDLVCNSRKFFLIDPEHGFQTMPEHTVRLLCGQTVLLEKLLPQRKYAEVV
jgi:hypothetical protein